MTLEKRWGTIGRSVVILLALLLLDGGSVTGQVFYNNFLGSLLQLNPDGTSKPIQIGNLPFAAEPVFSNDGRFLAVRSVDPNRPNQISSNIYVFDRVDGGLQQVTTFEDTFDPKTGNNFTYAPLYKTFSPDGSQLFVVMFKTVTTNKQGLGTTVLFAVYQTSDLVPPLAGPFVITNTDPLNTIGLGVSTSASSSAVALPLASKNGNKTTAIVAASGDNGFDKQLTFPQTGPFGPVGPVGEQSVFMEVDCFPSFSPDGESLAYFRVDRQTIFLTDFQPAQLSLRISDANGDRAIFSKFNPGLFPTGLNWTPDGSQLVFSIAKQETSGFFGFIPQPGTSEVATINVDGTGIRQLVPQGSSPAVAPVLGPSNIILGDVNLDGVVDFFDISPFIEILSSQGFQTEADLDLDLDVDFFDIAPFIAVLSGQ